MRHLGILAHSTLSLGLVALSFMHEVRIDLMSYLFGDLLAVGPGDLRWILGGSALVLVALACLWRPLLAITVHEELAQVEGLPVTWIRLALMLLVAIVIAVAMKIVGVLLITSLLIIPAATAQRLALTVAGELDVTGILAVELFETTDGRVLVNELAMRPHNTGHWSQDGAVTSQFENHLRAVMDLPLGSPAPRARWTVMVNILGGDRPEVGRLYDGYPHALARDPQLRVHLYGKDLRPGRKVGHVNAYGDDLDDCLERARHAAAWFRGDLGNESE